ncbi:hypothetical protein NCS57_00762500 [Fusarium keratoplasticum]|uniref:Uncharacterized protein n=1 Tax=Fusarium keratoplasticum TaxID=1328300 RepID=A0ACC0QWR1_9HYPO|nr:hypothetical protein NCS57_00762500 [Fusarium keratoplasticum]KAI8669472.1 hypothetical protein NCS57_00762500 [Fusarium keratoplasticum]
MDEEDPLANFSIADVSSDEAEADTKETRRTGQTEEAWRAIQRDYKTKVENGDVGLPFRSCHYRNGETDEKIQIHKKIKLPLGPGASKMDIQELIHAVEELYFFRRYHEAAQLATEALAGSDGLDRDSRQLLDAYQGKCQIKLNLQS